MTGAEYFKQKLIWMGEYPNRLIFVEKGVEKIFAFLWSERVTLETNKNRVFKG